MNLKISIVCLYVLKGAGAKETVNPHFILLEVILIIARLCLTAGEESKEEKQTQKKERLGEIEMKDNEMRDRDGEAGDSSREKR